MNYHILFEDVENIFLDFRHAYSLPVSKKIEIIEKISRGISYLHKANITHEELNSSNILVFLFITYN